MYLCCDFVVTLFCMIDVRLLNTYSDAVHVDITKKETQTLEQCLTRTSSTIATTITSDSLQGYSQSCRLLSYRPFPKNHWQEWPPDTIPLFMASGIFRNSTSQIMEWLGTVRPVVLWIARLFRQLKRDWDQKPDQDPAEWLGWKLCWTFTLQLIWELRWDC